MSPFATDTSQAISELGESALIERIKTWLGPSNPSAPHGIGDDCALLPPPTPGTRQLITADPVIYGKHFDDSLTPEQTAAKLARRNLSDIAAMGGRPTHAVICLAIDPDVSLIWIERFYLSLAAEAKRFEFHIVGGDISSTDNFVGAFLTLSGETLPDTPPILRRSALAGSHLFVTGELGGTRIQKHYNFTPRLHEAQWLAQSGLCAACTDLSDGLGKDHANLLSPGQSCFIDCAQLPISRDAQTTAAQTGKSPIFHAFNDGEDFELLFALQPNADIPVFLENWSKTFETPVSHIGTIVATDSSKPNSLILQNAPADLAATGYEHLR